MDGLGDENVLRWGEAADPVAGPGEVLIDVFASAVNRADLLQRQGLYSVPAGASQLLGLECSGTVAALGADVTGVAVGDEVCALLTGGGYATRVAVPAGQVMPLPAGVGLLDAAGLPEVACTVHANVVLTAHLHTDELLLVHGGSSGIGTFAIQYGVALGARVAVTAGSTEKLDRCRELGAELGVNYREQDFVEAVREATDGRGADVVLDNIGAKYLSRNVEVLAPDGRLVIIGLQGGVSAELNIGLLLFKRAALHAASLRNRSVAAKSAICTSVVQHVWPLYASGAIRPVVDRVLPMSEAADAHRLVATSTHVGKVLLEVPR